MSTAMPRRERRRDVRHGLKVIHRHRVGKTVRERISELVYIKGLPFALLQWINLGEIRTPLYVCELDATKLRAATDQRGVFHYDDLTADPRFLDTFTTES